LSKKPITRTLRCGSIANIRIIDIENQSLFSADNMDIDVL